MVSKDVVTLSKQLQCIMLHIYQYSVHIPNKPGPDLYIADWLSHHNHLENRNWEIAGMSINIYRINTKIDIPVYMSIEDVRAAVSEDTELQMLQTLIIRGLPQNKEELEPSLDSYWPIRLDLAMTDGVVMNGK